MSSKRSALLVSIVCLAPLACAPVEQGSIFIQGALPFGPNCEADAGRNEFQSQSVLDIGNDATTANDLIIPVKVVTNLPSTFTSGTLGEDRGKSPQYVNYGAADNNIITFTNATVFFSTDADRDGKPALTDKRLPTSDANARTSSLGGTLFNQQTGLSAATAVFVTAITNEDAAALQNDKFVSSALNGDPTKRVRVVTNVRIEGKTTGGADVRSPPFPYLVDLCQGCLTVHVDDCDPATAGAQPSQFNPDVCNPGQDLPVEVCPE